MAEALVSIVLEQLASVIHKQIEAQVTLVAGVDNEVQKLTSNFLSIRAVLEDAESKQVKDLAVRDWLDKLKHTSYDIDDVLDEWITWIGIKGIENASKPKRKVCSFIHCYRFCFRKVVLHRHIALKIKELNIKLDAIATEKNMFDFSLRRGSIELKRPETTSIIDDVSNIRGRDHDKDTLLMMLLNENTQEQAVPIISIVGMGGIGKTTLARLAFNDYNVNTHFDVKLWVCVSEPFDEKRIAKAILESLVGDASKLVELQTVMQEIRKFLQGKKFFLVLDDVWTEDPKDWEQLKGILKCGSQESRILVTTRKKSVAKIIGTTNKNMIMLELLLEEESWSLFSQIAFSERTSEERKKFEDIGTKIISKCKGLPLAIKTLASLLRFKTNIEEWANILESEMWQLEEVEHGVFPPLLLSYYDLPSTLRKCFSYCAIFPKDYEIEKDRLIELWMAQNYLRDERTKDMELIGEEYFENLAMRSFFQDFKRDELDRIESFKMHDIVHDFAQFLTKNECCSIEIDESKETQIQFSCEKARHLVLELKSEDSFPKYIYDAKKLRSLVIKYRTMSEMNQSKLFVEFTCLRRLDLSDCNFTILSREIEKLIHLRYLDLSTNGELKELPETLCELYNLQTLNLNSCTALKILPQGMGKLINLRHLINDWTCHFGLSEMPKGFERLTSLRTLGEFGVCRNREGTQTSGIEYLKDLNNLRGSLDVIGVGHVANEGEVKKANLVNKTNLLSLGLYFRRHDEVRENRKGIDEAVLEALLLQPPPNLERLAICHYEGKALSLNWMASLTKLRFLGFYNCINWEGWEKGDEDITIIMPSLHSLTIQNCEELKSLPDHILQTPTLTRLEIDGCPILKERYNNETGVDRIKISHIPRVEIF